MATTRTISFSITKPDGTPWSGAVLRFTLSNWSLAATGQIVPNIVSAVADADGNGTALLWANESDAETQCSYVVTFPDGTVSTSFNVPSGAGVIGLSELIEGHGAAYSPQFAAVGAAANIAASAASIAAELADSASVTALASATTADAATAQATSAANAATLAGSGTLAVSASVTALIVSANAAAASATAASASAALAGTNATAASASLVNVAITTLQASSSAALAGNAATAASASLVNVAITTLQASSSAAVAGANATAASASAVLAATNTLAVSASAALAGANATAASASAASAGVSALNASSSAAVATVSASVATTAANNVSYWPCDLWVPEVPFSSEVLFRKRAVGTWILPIALSGSLVDATTPASSASVISLQKNGVEFGQISFASGTATATLASVSGSTFGVSDVFTIVAPATPDTTLKGISINLRGTAV